MTMTLAEKMLMNKETVTGGYSMREEYEKLKWEITRFVAEDIITTSREYDEELDGEYVEE